MNKTIYLIFFILVFIGCTNEETIEEQESDFDQETTETIPINNEIAWSNGLGAVSYTHLTLPTKRNV